MAEKKKTPPKAKTEKESKGNILLKILLWVLTILMLAAAVAFFPSVSSFLAFFSAILLIPMEGAQRVWHRWKIKGGIKAILFIILFVACFSSAPSLNQDDKPDQAEAPSLSLADTRQEEPERKEPTQPEEPELSQKDLPEKIPPSETTAGPEPQTEPEPEPQTEPKTEPQSEAKPSDNKQENPFNTYDIPEQQQTENQWVLNEKSKKIHYKDCREVKKISPDNYNTSDLSEDQLLSQGYTVCKVCH